MAVPFAAVLRLSGFRFSQVELETLLETAVERYSLDGDGYAQIAIEGGELSWQTIDLFLERYGPALKILGDNGGVRSVCLDLAYEFNEGLALASYTVPARTAVLAGSRNVDLMFSAYLSTP